MLPVSIPLFILFCRSSAIIDESDVDLDKKLANLRQVVHELPRIYFDLLKRLMEHLDKYAYSKFLIV